MFYYCFREFLRIQYITIIDGDDALIHQNILNNSLNIANLGKLDVVEFKASWYINGIFQFVLNSFDIFHITGIVYQPELRTKFITKGNITEGPIRSRSIWGKLIRNVIFKRAIINIGAKYTEDFISNFEDTIMIFAIYQIANSYYLMKEKGYYYSGDDKRDKFPSLKYKTCKPNNKIKDMGHVKFLQYLVEKTKDNDFERQMVYYEIISVNYYYNFLLTINHHYEMIYEVLDIMIKSPYIKSYQKENLMNLKDNLLKKQNRKKI